VERELTRRNRPLSRDRLLSHFPVDRDGFIVPKGFRDFIEAVWGAYGCLRNGEGIYMDMEQRPWIWYPVYHQYLGLSGYFSNASQLLPVQEDGLVIMEDGLYYVAACIGLWNKSTSDGLYEIGIGFVPPTSLGEPSIPKTTTMHISSLTASEDRRNQPELIGGLLWIPGGSSLRCYIRTPAQSGSGINLQYYIWWLSAVRMA